MASACFHLAVLSGALGTVSALSSQGTGHWPWRSRNRNQGAKSDMVVNLAKDKTVDSHTAAIRAALSTEMQSAQAQKAVADFEAAQAEMAFEQATADLEQAVQEVQSIHKVQFEDATNKGEKERHKKMLNEGRSLDTMMDELDKRMSKEDSTDFFKAIDR